MTWGAARQCNSHREKVSQKHCALASSQSSHDTLQWAGLYTWSLLLALSSCCICLNYTRRLRIWTLLYCSKLPCVAAVIFLPLARKGMLRSWTGSLTCSLLSAFLMSKSLDSRRPISQDLHSWDGATGTLGNQKYSTDCKSQSTGNRWYFAEHQQLGETCNGLNGMSPWA